MRAGHGKAFVFMLRNAAAALALVCLAAGPSAAGGIDPDATVTSDGRVYSPPDPGVASSAGFLPESEPALLPSEWTFPVPKDALPIDPPDRTVIGEDGRVQVTDTTTFPQRAVAQLYVTFPGGSSGTCSGWFSGPRTVVTAGHCVYDHAYGGWPINVRVYPGRDGSSYPFGFATSSSFRSVAGWTVNADPGYDYGAVILDNPLSDTVGFFSFRVFRNLDLGMRVRITGYPGDKEPGTMWSMRGRVQRKTRRRLFYSIDTYQGQSGSPIYGAGAYAVGVHTYGTLGDPMGTHNSGTRINAAMFNNLYEWSAP